MGGFFGVVAKEDCVFDLYYGTDYHSHLGTRRAGMVTYDRKEGFDRAIHNIESAAFRPKFEKDIQKMAGHYGIGCISDYEPQPLIIRSHHGTYAITTVGRINNATALADMLFRQGCSHFLEMSGGDINPTELVAAMINQKDSLLEGIRYVQEQIDGSITLLVLTEEGLYAARDRLGRTPVQIGAKDGARCACFERFSFLNLGYQPERELGPGEVVFLTPDGVEVLRPAEKKKRICTFLWVYYGFPASSYEGLSVETARYACGKKMAERDRIRKEVDPDLVAGVPDSGVAHAIGYANESGVPYGRPFVKYTPTWPRSFLPPFQSKRDLIAKMKLLPIQELIDGKTLLLIDDSIVRGTQLRESADYLFDHGAKEVHVRPACPPIVYSCKYLSFSRSTSEGELIARRKIYALEGSEQITPERLAQYTDPDSEPYHAMLEEIRKEMHFSSLHYHRLDDLIAGLGFDLEDVCTYCWDGRE